MKLYLSALAPCLLAGWVAAAQADDTAFFESKIRPVLVKHCYECHSSESGKAKGGLTLDTRSGIRAGGETGPAVVPGDPANSLLLTAIRHEDPDLEMPPKAPALAKAVAADFETWIKQGAPDPRESATAVAERPPLDLKSGRQFWSYRPVQVPSVPVVKDPAWPRDKLDHFILAALEQKGLAPSPDAQPAVLLRRLYFDLIGLPPTPKQTLDFAGAWKAAAEDQNKRETLLQATVDALLQSPRFGERWGRHWLDVARFAESNGRESNLTFPHAWRYRDYVVDAVNADKPFDRFITEQIAGDLLHAKDDTERAQLLIATGFLAMGAKGLNEMNPVQFAADLADEQLDTVTRAFTAASVACARCHDHKSEPFSMEDYYALAGIFKSTQTHYGTWVDSENNNSGPLIRLPDLPGQLIPNKSVPAATVKKLKADRAKLDADEKAQDEYLVKARLEGKDLGNEGFKLLSNAIRILWSRGAIDGQLMKVDDKGRALPLCMGALDSKKIQDASLLNRGEISQPVKQVKRGFPEILQVGGIEPATHESGRLELARWLTHPEHPLTARVIVNRLWRQMFGTGLVRTPDNFGFSGERPTHPELLDHLAHQMVANGWSMKAMIREIALSRTYRQASTYRQEVFDQDPDNRLYWRANKRRLDAEVIRDSMLAVSGELDLSRRPGSLVAELDGQSVSLMGFNEHIPEDLDGSLRRSVYLPVVRDHLPDVLELFDFAEPSLVTGSRDVTNVPLQALYLMNGPWVQARAAALAARVTKERATLPDRLRRAFTLCFNRPPDKSETELADQFFQKARGSIEGNQADETELLARYCQALLASAEFRHAD